MVRGTALAPVGSEVIGLTARGAEAPTVMEGEVREPEAPVERVFGSYQEASRKSKQLFDLDGERLLVVGGWTWPEQSFVKQSFGKQAF